MGICFTWDWNVPSVAVWIIDSYYIQHDERLSNNRNRYMRECSLNLLHSSKTSLLVQFWKFGLWFHIPFVWLMWIGVVFFIIYLSSSVGWSMGNFRGGHPGEPPLEVNTRAPLEADNGKPSLLVCTLWLWRDFLLWCGWKRWAFGMPVIVVVVGGGSARRSRHRFNVACRWKRGDFGKPLSVLTRQNYW